MLASCDLCHRNVSKGTVAKVPMGKLNFRDIAPVFNQLYSICNA